MNKAREFDQSVVSELKALLGDRVSTSAAGREHHGKDESYFPHPPPDALVLPETDAHLGHNRGWLRHPARERAVAESGARRRPHHPALAAREEVGRGLRPDAT